jgi:hypothetical protein
LVGVVKNPDALVQLHGRSVGAPDDLNTFMAMVNNAVDLELVGIFHRPQPGGHAAAVLAGAMSASGWRHPGSTRAAGDHRATGRASSEHRHQSRRQDPWA